ncbi:hypothetical protein ZWY2020_060035 [Hordeum vulgare]|nr:hypothetical protein ZWY2020_060035 [Hordeum vulgare]
MGIGANTHRPKIGGSTSERKLDSSTTPFDDPPAPPPLRHRLRPDPSLTPASLLRPPASTDAAASSRPSLEAVARGGDLGAGDSPSGSPTSSTPPGPPPRLGRQRRAHAAPSSSASDLTAAGGSVLAVRCRSPHRLPTSPRAPCPSALGAKSPAAHKVLSGLLAR